MITNLLLSLAFWSATVCAQSKFPEMNGISFETYKDFTKDWNLVTVRYRKDSGEMRFTYANREAFSALKNESSNYPNGAIFGKVSFVTGQDPSYLSSVMPMAPSRVQLMVRDKIKYKNSNGWGYALFTPDGKLMPGDIKEKTESCVACHSIVEESGHVFSKPIGFIKTSKFNALESLKTKKVYFTTSKVSDLPPYIQKLLPSADKNINDLQGVLKKHFFYGTFDEIRPTLIKESLRTRKPSILIGDDNKSFSLVFINKSGHCSKGETEIMSFHTGPKPKRKVIEIKVCVGDK